MCLRLSLPVHEGLSFNLSTIFLAEVLCAISRKEIHLTAIIERQIGLMLKPHRSVVPLSLFNAFNVLLF